MPDLRPVSGSTSTDTAEERRLIDDEADEFDDEEEDDEEETPAASSSSGSGRMVKRRRRSKRRRQKLRPATAIFHYGMFGVFVLMFLFAIMGGAARQRLQHAVEGALPFLKNMPFLRVEFVAIFLAFGLWLYLSPGFSDNLQEFFGLKKRRTHRRSRGSS
jgi:hypothetical protein